MDASTSHLSRRELEQIAQPIIEQYKQKYVPLRHLCYRVNPPELAELLGYKVEYAYLTQDGSILGQTASVPLWTTVINITLGETYYHLDGKTILVEKRLLCNPQANGCKNFTIAHELAHLILNQRYPSMYDSQYRHCCFNRKTSKKRVYDWYEWQADTLAVSLLLPPDAIEAAMFMFGLGSKMKVLSRKYSQRRYELFCEMAQFLGVSKTTLAYRMENLGLLERNYLIKEAQQRRGIVYGQRQS